MIKRQLSVTTFLNRISLFEMRSLWNIEQRNGASEPLHNNNRSLTSQQNEILWKFSL